jgi:hypothetical protein
LNLTRRSSLLTQSRPYSYSKAIGPQNRAKNCSGNTNKNNLYSYRHFTEHLVDVFRKPPQKSDSNHETSSF